MSRRFYRCRSSSNSANRVRQNYRLAGIRQTADCAETFSTDILKTSGNHDTGVCDTTRVRILASGRAQASRVEQRQLQFLQSGTLNITLGNIRRANAV